MISNKCSLFNVKNGLSAVGEHDVCQKDVVEHENKSQWTD